MKQENFPSLKKLGFANIDGGVTDRVTNSFISFIRDKPELIYNILSYEKNIYESPNIDHSKSHSKSKNKSKKEVYNILVAVRCRPLSKKEKEISTKSILYFFFLLFSKNVSSFL